MLLTKTERTNILERLEKLTKQKDYLNQIDFFKIKEIMSSKLGLSFETIEDDIYKNHIDNDKYVFLSEHKKYPHFFNSSAKTFGALIEGDNLLALFLLQNIYKEEKDKVDFIYIDPPYNNTNAGFIYNNDYRVKGKDKGLCQVNKEDNFRHSKWLSIMKIRLEYAKKLMKDTGLIAVSIDDHELYNLKLLMDAIFGSECYKSTIVWDKKSGIWVEKNVQKIHEYILIYEKTWQKSKFNFFASKKEVDKPFKWIKMMKWGVQGKWDPNSTLWYPIIYKDQEIWPISIRGEKKLWAISQKTFSEEKEKGNIDFKKNSKGDWEPYRKREIESEKSFLKSVESSFGNGGAKNLTKDLDNPDKANVFSYPKPIALIKHLIKHVAPKDGLILDFFAGSGTTGCAVAELNKDDDGSRKFVLVTNNDGDDIKQIKDFKNDENKNSYCVFRDVLYPRLKKQQKKYDLSCEVFKIGDHVSQSVNETFVSRQKEYIDTCFNLLSILDVKKEQKYFYYNKKKQNKGDQEFSNVVEINDARYGFFENDLDVNMRFAFKLRKNGE